MIQLKLIFLTELLSKIILFFDLNSVGVCGHFVTLTLFFGSEIIKKKPYFNFSRFKGKKVSEETVVLC